MTETSREETAASAPTAPNSNRTVSPRSSLSMFQTLGEITKFGGQVIKDVPFTLRNYPTEVLRQAGIIIVSSAFVIWALFATLGIECGLLARYLFEPLGLSSYTGIFCSLGDLKAAGVAIFSWMYAAKIGCGFVATIGSMRISEEIDALHVMGMRPRAYLASSRLIAFWITGPFLWWSGVSMMYLTSWISNVPMLESASSGGYLDVFWSFQTPVDVLKTTIWAVVSGTVISVVGLYFGYTASGGPVGVGHNTARSMTYNMVLISLVAMIMFPLLFGIIAVIPIAN